MKQGTKVVVILGRHKDSEGKVATKKEAQGVNVEEGQVPVKIEIKGELKVKPFNLNVLRKL